MNQRTRTRTGVPSVLSDSIHVPGSMSCKCALVTVVWLALTGIWVCSKDKLRVARAWNGEHYRVLYPVEGERD